MLWGASPALELPPPRLGSPVQTPPWRSPHLQSPPDPAQQPPKHPQCPPHIFSRWPRPPPRAAGPWTHGRETAPPPPLPAQPSLAGGGRVIPGLSPARDPNPASGLIRRTMPLS